MVYVLKLALWAISRARVSIDSWWYPTELNSQWIFHPHAPSDLFHHNTRYKQIHWCIVPGFGIDLIAYLHLTMWLNGVSLTVSSIRQSECRSQECNSEYCFLWMLLLFWRGCPFVVLDSGYQMRVICIVRYFCHRRCLHSFQRYPAVKTSKEANRKQIWMLNINPCFQVSFREPHLNKK